MRRVVLTDVAVQRLKPAKPKSRDNYWDALTPSLALRVTETGHKSWVIQRRVNGRMLRVKLGDYPALSIADARIRARIALEEMLKGRDPRQTHLKIAAATARADTFEAAIEEYIRREVLPNRRPRTQSEIIRPLRTIFAPRWGTLQLSEISPRDVLNVLDEIVDADKPVSANRTFSAVRRFFRWAVERQMMNANPAGNLRKPSKEVARDRALTDQELIEVWTQATTLGWPFGPFIHTLILTGQRRSEVSGMTWAEIDLDARIWTMSAARTKNGRQHVIPISESFAEILAVAPRFTNVDCPIFSTNGQTAISGFGRAKRRLDTLLALGRKLGTAPIGVAGVDKTLFPAWTLHDLRRSTATGLGRIGIFPHVIEVTLNHSSGFRSGVAGVYQRHPYLAERKAALSLWSSHIASLLRTPAGNIAEFRSRPLDQLAAE